jgi:hypothetical protein
VRPALSQNKKRNRSRYKEKKKQKRYKTEALQKCALLFHKTKKEKHRSTHNFHVDWTDVFMGFWFFFF